MVSQNLLSWKGPTRMIELSSWVCTAPPERVKCSALRWVNRNVGTLQQFCMPIEELVWEALSVLWTCVFSTFLCSPGKASAFASNARITADNTRAELELCSLLSHLQGSCESRYCRFLSSLVLIVDQTDGVVTFFSQIWWTKASKPSPFLCDAIILGYLGNDWEAVVLLISKVFYCWQLSTKAFLSC